MDSSMHDLIQSLEAKGYTFLSRYTFRELIHPLREGLQYPNVFTRMMWGFTLLGAVWAGISFGVAGLTFWKFLAWFVAGVPATLLLVPLHEMLHGWMFRWFGAKDVRYGVIWRYLMFYAVAHRFVVNYRQFRYIALAPFVVISLLSLLCWFLVPAEGKALIPGLYIFHTVCCAGDFGLCAYFFKYKSRQPLSFDDADNHISYFYALPALDSENS